MQQAITKHKNMPQVKFAKTAREYFKKNQGNMTFEPVNTTDDGKSQTIKAQYSQSSRANFNRQDALGATGVADSRYRIRKLTPRECFLFMGFTDSDYDRVIENNPDVHINSKLFPRDKLIRMAGNSIPVKLLEGIFYQIKKIDELLSDE